ncbi:MAG: hypothetical protein ABI592_01120 [Acidobacteriota bacterium]
MCAACLETGYRWCQRSNLIYGWWGPRSFVLTPIYTFQNWREYRRAKVALGGGV